MVEVFPGEPGHFVHQEGEVVHGGGGVELPAIDGQRRALFQAVSDSVDEGHERGCFGDHRVSVDPPAQSDVVAHHLWCCPGHQLREQGIHDAVGGCRDDVQDGLDGFVVGDRGCGGHLLQEQDHTIPGRSRRLH